MPVLGYESTLELLEALRFTFGSEAIKLVGDFGPLHDAMGFKLNCRQRYLLSVSTRGGSLPFGRYDFQISILDDSSENGEIVFLDEVSLEHFLQIVEDLKNGIIF
jgi:hypothetical protein